VRTAYLGTSEFATTVLRRLAGSPHRPALVVTPPDRRQGRGRKVQPPPVAVAASELGLDLLQAENVNDEAALERIRAARPEAVLVCAFGQLICVMRLTEGLDSGPVALCEETPIELEEDFASLSARLAELGGDLLVRALDLQVEGALEFTEQDESGVTYAEKIDPAERRLDPDRPAAELAAKVRGLNPHVGTYLETAARERLGVRRAHVVEADVAQGTLEARFEALLLGTGEGALQLDVVQPPGGKAMPADAYLRGHEPPQL
jgi:methionyl-tRNA formyltransferase